MLIGVDPLLRGSLLARLDEMGHGDMLVIADANFPARRLGPHVIDLPVATAIEAIRAIATVFPIDPDEPISLMSAPVGTPDIHAELVRAAGRTGADRAEAITRFEFYERAQESVLIVATGELRPYGNLILRKGVVTDGKNQ